MTDKVALIMAGGTGGHIFPGLALAHELQQRSWKIEWLGSEGGMEQKLVRQHNIKIHSISVSGVRGKGIIKLVTAPWLLLKAVIQAKRVVKQVQPDLIVGFGGFASGPGGIAGKLVGKRLVIHEQNAIAGMTNRMLAKVADKVLAAFPGALLNAQVVGNPVRKAFAQVKQIATDVESLNILVVGGSRGARALNNFMPKLLASLQDKRLINCRHQVGKGNVASVVDQYANQGLKGKVDVVEFIDDMPSAYQWADLVICRAGALTVSEVATSGRVALFVPFPYAVDDHQTKNAEYLVEKGAAFCTQEKDLDVNEVSELVANLNRDQLVEMAAKAKQLSHEQACVTIANYCEEVAHVG